MHRVSRYQLGRDPGVGVGVPGDGDQGSGGEPGAQHVSVAILLCHRSVLCIMSFKVMVVIAVSLCIACFESISCGYSDVFNSMLAAQEQI